MSGRKWCLGLLVGRLIGSDFRHIVRYNLSILRILRLKYRIYSYKFRQASDFWYLTGFEEPDSAVILQKNSSTRGYRMTLFSTGPDSYREKWDGARTSKDDVVQHFKADAAESITSFPDAFKSLKSDPSFIYIDMPPGMSRRGRPVSHKTLLKVCLPCPRGDFSDLFSVSIGKLKFYSPRSRYSHRVHQSQTTEITYSRNSQVESREEQGGANPYAQSRGHKWTCAC